MNPVFDALRPYRSPSTTPVLQIEEWRMKKKLKTTNAVLVLCLNLGVDPPDRIRADRHPTMYCWIDPSTKQHRPVTQMGAALKKQYERLQPRARYKQCLDPTTDVVRKACQTLRRQAKRERVLFHYNGGGVPRVSPNGEIWLFNKTFTQYIPLSVYDLHSWMRTPSLYVLDCSYAGLVVEGLLRVFDGERERNPRISDNIVLAACGANECLPANPDFPADLFTSCLTTPIKMSLKWFCMKKELLHHIPEDVIRQIPGRLSDRRTALGELNWIFTALMDTIAWDVLPRNMFQKLFRQDLLVASLFRSFLLANRIMRAANCLPVSVPRLPETQFHPLWNSWDLALDVVINEVRDHVSAVQKYRASFFFTAELTEFEIWLRSGRHLEENENPTKLPMLLQVLLSQTHRKRALKLLLQYLQGGPRAVNLALSVGIFPYVLKLLQGHAKELREVLVPIWALVLAFDQSAQLDLVRERGHEYFLAVLDLWRRRVAEGIPHHAGQCPITIEMRAQCCFILSHVMHGFESGQMAVLSGGNILPFVCFALRNGRDEGDLKFRQWLILMLSQLVFRNEEAQFRSFADGLLADLLTFLNSEDLGADLRATIVYALGCHVNMLSDVSRKPELVVQSEVKMGLVLVDNIFDGSPLVRREILYALASLVVGYVERIDREQFEGLFDKALRERRRFRRNIAVRRGSVGGAAAAAGMAMGSTTPPPASSGPTTPISLSSSSTLHGGAQTPSASPPMSPRSNFSVSTSASSSTSTPSGIESPSGAMRPRRGRKINVQLHLPAAAAAAAAANTAAQPPPPVQLARPRAPRPDVEDDTVGRGRGRGVPQRRDGGRGRRQADAAMSALMGLVGGADSPDDEEEEEPDDVPAVFNVVNRRGGGGGGDSGHPLHRRRRHQQQASERDQEMARRRAIEAEEERQRQIELEHQTAAFALDLCRVLCMMTYDPFEKVSDLAWRILCQLEEYFGLNLRKNRQSPLDDSHASPRVTPMTPHLTPSELDGASAPSVASSSEFRTMSSEIENPQATQMLELWNTMPHSVFFRFASAQFFDGGASSPKKSDVAVILRQQHIQESLLAEALGAMQTAASERLETERLYFGNEVDAVRQMRLHSSRRLLLCRDDFDKITLWHYIRGKEIGHFGTYPHVRGRLTDFTLLNEKFVRDLLLVTSASGSVCVYENYARPTDRRVLTSFIAVPEANIESGDGVGIITSWQQQNGLLVVGGDVATLKLWDLTKEVCCASIKTKIRSCVTCLASDPSGGGSVFVAGTGNRAMIFVDQRIRRVVARCFSAVPEPPKKRGRRKSRRAPSLYVDCFMQKVDPSRVYAADSEGVVEVWDMRRTTEPVLRFDTSTPNMTSFGVHPFSPIFAVGSPEKCVKVYNTGGDPLSSICYHEGLLGRRIGPVSALTFHPFRKTLAVACTDNVIGIYE